MLHAIIHTLIQKHTDAFIPKNSKYESWKAEPFPWFYFFSKTSEKNDAWKIPFYATCQIN